MRDTDFDSASKQHDVLLVKFYAPWCGHCKRIAPEFEKAATTLKNNDPPVALAEVDCTTETATCTKHGISGYPTLKIFKKGEFAFEYGGPREADGIVKYMRSKAGPAFKTLQTAEELDKFLSANEHVVVGFFESDGSAAQKTFVQVADGLADTYRFAQLVGKKDLADKHGFNNDIVVYQPKHLQTKFESATTKYTGDLVVHKIKSWIGIAIAGLCGHRTSGNADSFGKPLVIAYYNVDYIKDPKGTNYWRNRILKVAEKFTVAARGSASPVYFAVSNAQDLSHELTAFGLGDKVKEGAKLEKPIIGAFDEKDRKFAMKAEYSPEALEQFAKDLADGKLEPYLKTEPVPIFNEGPLKTIVASEFDKYVNDPTKDVLIEFYAPWCGHCKSLEPKYKKLAKKMRFDMDTLTIAKMDATANDVPKPFEVHGFPTIFFVKKDNKKEPMKYEGEREVEKFIEFLAKEATTPLKGFDRSGKLTTYFDEQEARERAERAAADAEDEKAEAEEKAKKDKKKKEKKEEL